VAQIEPIDDPVAICEVINDAAAAYRGVIPADRWHEPYMTLAELLRRYWSVPERQIEESVVLQCSDRSEPQP
jgi:hypothetical protein